MSFKYQNVAQVGDRIRSYDFRGCDDCYIEGEVIGIDLEGKCGCAAFNIVVDKDVWDGENSEIRMGMKYNVPMEVSFLEWEGRIVKLSSPS